MFNLFSLILRIFSSSWFLPQNNEEFIDILLYLLKVLWNRVEIYVIIWWIQIPHSKVYWTVKKESLPKKKYIIKHLNDSLFLILITHKTPIIIMISSTLKMLLYFITRQFLVWYHKDKTIFHWFEMNSESEKLNDLANMILIYKQSLIIYSSLLCCCFFKVCCLEIFSTVKCPASGKDGGPH